jgi:hypothetical protein
MASPVVFASVRKRMKRKGLREIFAERFVQSVRKRLKMKGLQNDGKKFGGDGEWRQTRAAMEAGERTGGQQTCGMLSRKLSRRKVLSAEWLIWKAERANSEVEWQSIAGGKSRANPKAALSGIRIGLQLSELSRH